MNRFRSKTDYPSILYPTDRGSSSDTSSEYSLSIQWVMVLDFLS